MTGPEQHAATVRAALDAGASAESLGSQFRRGERPEAYVAVDALEAFAAAREAAEARADELQRERDEAWFERVETTLANGDKDYVVWCRHCGTHHQRPEHCPARQQARRPPDELRARARRVEYAWENLRGWMPNGRGVPNWTREMDKAIAALAGPTSSDDQAEPVPGVQAEEQTPERCGNCGAGREHIGYDHALGFNCNKCGAADSDE